MKDEVGCTVPFLPKEYDMGMDICMNEELGTAIFTFFS